MCRYLFHNFSFALRRDRLSTALQCDAVELAAFLFSQPHAKCRANRQEKKKYLKRETVVPFCFPSPHFLPALFPRSFTPVKMQVKPSESQLAKSREPQARSVHIGSNFFFIISPHNPVKSSMFSAPFFGSRRHWLIANYFIP